MTHDSVTRRSMQTLRPGKWLNDEVINYFLKNCLAKRDEFICARQTGRKRSHFFNSFFVQTMFDEKNSNPSLRGRYNYDNVSHWSKNVPGKNIFKLKYILIPINLDNMHWTTAVIYMEEKRIQYYDSMGGTDEAKLKGLFQYVQDEYMAKNGGQEMDVSGWVLVPCTSDTPQQTDAFNCGAFACSICDNISQGCGFLFNQSNMDEYRKRIILSIIKNCAIEFPTTTAGSTTASASTHIDLDANDDDDDNDDDDNDGGKRNVCEIDVCNAVTGKRVKATDNNYCELKGENHDDISVLNDDNNDDNINSDNDDYNSNNNNSDDDDDDDNNNLKNDNKHNEVNYSDDDADDSSSSSIVTLEKKNGKLTIRAKLQVIECYDKLLAKHGKLGILKRVEKKFSNITSNNIGKVVKARHTITSTTNKDGSVLLFSKACKVFTVDECEALLTAHRKHRGDWDLIAVDVKRSPDACRRKYKQLEGKNQCTSVQQFLHMPEDIHNLLSNTLTDGENEYKVLIHVNYIGQDNMIEMSADMIGDFIDRFTAKYNRRPSTAAMQYMKSQVGEKPLLPDTVVRFLIDYKKNKESNLPHIKNPKTNTFRETVNTHVYASDCLFQAINKHRYSPDRGDKWYGQGRDYSEHLYLNFITAQDNKKLLFSPCSLEPGCPNDGFFKTLFPVRINRCYKVTFVGDDIKNATFDRII